MQQGSENSVAPALAWWRFGHVWLVIAGPALVIVAGIITIYLALARPDPVVSADDYRQGLELTKARAGEAALAPAMQARNHAATGVVPPPEAAAAAGAKGGRTTP